MLIIHYWVSTSIFYNGKQKGKREKIKLEEKVKSIKRKNNKTNGKKERSDKKNPTSGASIE